MSVSGEGQDEVYYKDSNLGGSSENFLVGSRGNFITRAVFLLCVWSCYYACGYFITRVNKLYKDIRELTVLCLILCKKIDSMFKKVKNRDIEFKYEQIPRI